MNVPKLRFKEFTDEWIAIKLNDISKTFDYGMNVASTSFDGKNKYIRITDIDDVSHKFLKNNIVSPSGSLEDKYLVRNDDILFARTGASTGKTYLYNSNDGILYFAGFLIRINVLKSYNSYFIFQNTLTKKYTDWVKVESIRSGQPGINAEQYKSYSIKCPTLAEQNKIANFLTTVDKKITNLENTITSLENQKKGLLQQIFSQKLRFKDKNGNNYPNWEKKKLGDIAVLITKGTTPTNFNDGNINFIKVESIINSKINLSKCMSISENTHFSILSRSILKENDILFAIAGSLGISCIVNKEILPANTNQALAIIRLSNNVNINYIFWTLNSNIMKKYIKISHSIGAQPNLNLKQLNDFILPYPCLEEQTKIADFLSAFDRKLDNQKAQLEHWKQIKKGLLQQMFV